jgi:hypothetical protein
MIVPDSIIGRIISFGRNNVKKTLYLDKKALTYFTDFPTNEKTLTLGQNIVKKAYEGYRFRNYQGLAEYTHSFGKHNFTLLAGASALQKLLMISVVTGQTCLMAISGR